MKIKDVIGSEQVEVGLRVSDKSQLLRELSRRAAAAASIDQNVVHDVLASLSVSVSPRYLDARRGG
jgi:hypothetical protein